MLMELRHKAALGNIARSEADASVFLAQNLANDLETLRDLRRQGEEVSKELVTLLQNKQSRTATDVAVVDSQFLESMSSLVDSLGLVSSCVADEPICRTICNAHGDVIRLSVSDGDSGNNSDSAAGFHHLMSPMPASRSEASQVDADREHHSLGIIPLALTTLVVRNIPLDCSAQKLMQEWVPDGSYNLLYVPWDWRVNKSLGYCFMNFVTQEKAIEFWNRWHSARLRCHTGSANLDVALAARQGYEAILWHLRPKVIRFKNAKLLPVLFQGRTRLNTREVLARMTMP